MSYSLKIDFCPLVYYNVFLFIFLKFLGDYSFSSILQIAGVSSNIIYLIGFSSSTSYSAGIL